MAHIRVPGRTQVAEVAARKRTESWSAGLGAVGESEAAPPAPESEGKPFRGSREPQLAATSGGAEASGAPALPPLSHGAPGRLPRLTGVTESGGDGPAPAPWVFRAVQPTLTTVVLSEVTLYPFFSQLAGGVILGVALWLRHDPQTTNLLYLELGDRPAPNTFYVGIYILIAVGAVMMFVGFLGCYGAIQESQCLLGTFFTCLVILFACEVAAGIWGFVNKDQIAKDVKQFYDQALQQAVVDDDANNAKAVVKTFHETLNCCGSSTLSTLTTSIFKNNLCPSSSTIISNLKEDCHQKIDDLFSGKLYLIGIAAIVVAVIMIFEMILSMVLCCGIRNSSVY
uniref:LOW QUALITY PROTEIN: CD81 antigen n=1 Tax=Odobenus rosmarus divergens TaxID=9708 RepID=UPI00063CDA71|nr:PREDICTED: LOW QUALITY PROTEIN: CD81 antigen [Odobenus rosmarus divergens]